MAITTGLENCSNQSHQGQTHHAHNNHHNHNGHHYQHNGHHGLSPNHFHLHHGTHYHHAQKQQNMAQSVMIDVWNHNFHDSMRILRQLAKQCKVVAVDTEFPGVVAKMQGDYGTTFEQAYHNIRANIDILKPIQIGFSFFKDDGSHPQAVSTIQFNFKWDIDYETYADNSIQLLQQSGIDFIKLKKEGIALEDFGEAFLTSGLALNENLTWIGFHSAYDWAYLLKILTCWSCMPKELHEYQKLLLLYFPRIVDIKSLMGENNLFKGGLQELADTLKVKRVGAQHQAGSDSKLTGETYFRFIDEYCTSKVNEKHVNLVYGLNYCPQGAHYLWAPMTTPSPTPDDVASASGNSCSGSSNNSGRSSPESSSSSMGSTCES